VPVSTYPGLLEARLRRDAARPLVTFHDDATGERVELSGATYANWVAKTASLVQDELDLGRGALALVELPTHWCGAVWLGAGWTVGLRLTDDPALLDEADLVVCGPDGVDRYAGIAAGPGETCVVALALRPLGGRFTETLPDGVVDYGAVVLGQPDHFVALDPPTGDDLAWQDEQGTISQAGLVTAAGADDLTGRDGRLLTDVNPASRAGLRTLVAPLARGGSTVWVRHPDDARWPEHARAEGTSAELRTAGQPPRS
jgi:uncharacterized protein (TIGR03089 family)